MRNAPIGRPSTYPHASRREEVELSPIDYDLMCSDWARKLTESNLRSLASDYMRGIRDESTEDAYEEYKRRERLGLLKDDRTPSKSLKTRKSRTR